MVTSNKNASYSIEQKEAAVLAYLSGEGSLDSICTKYKIHGQKQLLDWVLKYNSHEKLKASGTGGKSIMTKGRNTTFYERNEIVKYCKWLNRKENSNEKFNKELLPLIKDAYEERNGILGYRQMTIKLNREHNLQVNHKRIYRLMSILNLKSICRRKKKNYIKSTSEITAENVLNRDFKADKFGEKWLTD